jgi:hypothetical protein
LSDGIFVDSKSKIYNISGTTETDSSSFPIPANTYEELWRDYEKVSTDFQTFNQFLIDEGVIYNDYDSPGDFNPFTTEISDISDKRFFMIMAQVFNNSDKFNTFKSTIITNELDKSTPNLSKKFNKIVNNFRDKVKDELDAEEKYYKTLKKSEKYRNYLVVENLYKKGKIRKFIYTTEPSSTNDQQIKNLTLLYNGNNGGDKTTWTDKTQFN